MANLKNIKRLRIGRSMSKYKNKKIKTEDGIFDSKKEFNRWLQLKKLEEEGSIKNLQRQVEFVLIPAQKNDLGKVIERKCSYVADFVYDFMDEKIVEDVKGYRKGVGYSFFVIKRKLMLWVYKIKVVEV